VQNLALVVLAAPLRRVRGSTALHCDEVILRDNAHRDTVDAGLDADAADIPEIARLVHQAVVWRVDEDRHLEALAVLHRVDLVIAVVALDLADVGEAVGLENAADAGLHLVRHALVGGGGGEAGKRQGDEGEGNHAVHRGVLRVGAAGRDAVPCPTEMPPRPGPVVR